MNSDPYGWNSYYPDYDKDLKFDEWAHQITDCVYLGSEEAALVPLDQLKERKILSILVVGSELRPKHETSKVIRYLKLGVEDVPGANLLKEFKRCSDFIREAREKKECVLVHCAMGYSRSPTIVAAWLMTDELITSDEAIKKNFVKKGCWTQSWLSSTIERIRIST